MAVIRLQGQEEKYGACVYEYDERNMIGRGGMGEVFIGMRTDSHGARSRVAVKHLTNTSPEVVERARCEASIYLRNDNLVYMYGFVEKRSGDIMGSVDYYIVSEFVDGISLDAFTEGNLVGSNGTISPSLQSLFESYVDAPARMATEIVKAVLSGIMALHDAGYIHRDIDPTNIMVTTDGKYKLIDYGVARKVDELHMGDDRAQGVFVGKVEYAAPELIRGEVQKQGFCTDIYSVGILYFQLATGHLPFRGDRLSIINQQLKKPMPLQDVASGGIREIIRKATAKGQDKRYASAALFRADLDRLDDSDLKTGTPPAINWRKVAIVAAMVAMVVAVVTSLSLSLSPSSSPSGKGDAKSLSGNDGINSPLPKGEGAGVRPDSTKAAYAYAMRLLDNENKDSVAKGFITMKQLASKGYPDAVYEVAYIYAFNNKASRQKRALGIRLDSYGKPVSKEVRIAGVKWLKTAIDSDNPKAYRCMYWLTGYQTDKGKIVRLLRNALYGARNAGDKEYATKIENTLNDLSKRQ